MTVLLRCPVRGCVENLNRGESGWTCARRHSFDQHRFGFLNLLQPQDRRSKTPGDSLEAARARRQLARVGYALEVYGALSHAVTARARGKAAALLDVGCGEGAFLRYLDGVPALELHGVDISAPAIELAARASPRDFFVVANADRFLPYADQSFDFIISIDARLNAAEFDRVLKKDGLVLVAVPGPADLVELREKVQGGRVEKSRAPRVEEELGKSFRLLARSWATDRRTFDPPALRDLLTATYRGFRKSEREAVAALDSMTVTHSHEILTFEKR